jgi:hypothetical protein
MSSYLGAFTTQLVRFFEDLSETYPEEREIKMALEAITGLKKINPKMLLELFYDYAYKPIGEAILREDEEVVIQYAKSTIQVQFNEMSVALMIFDKHWATMSDSNRQAIWKYLKVLITLCEKAKGM